MAEKKSTKRIEKKKARKNQRANLIQSGYDAKSVNKLQGSKLTEEVKKVDKQKQYKNNRQYLLSQGIDNRIISRNQLYRRTEKFLTDRQNINKWRKETRELHRFDRLIDAGFKKSEIKKSWLRYDKITDRIIFDRIQYTVHYNPFYIGVMYSEIYSDEMTMEGIEEMSFSEIFKEYMRIIDKAFSEPDNSDGFHGVFKIVIGSSKKNVQHACKVWNMRGYNVSVGKFSKDRYETLIIKNDFSLREYLDLLYFVFAHEKNEDIINDYKTFYKYAEDFHAPKVFARLFPYAIDK